MFQFKLAFRFKNYLVECTNHYSWCFLMVETLTFSGVVWKEEELYVAWCPELDVASQGKRIEEALDNLREAIELYLEDEDVTSLVC